VRARAQIRDVQQEDTVAREPKVLKIEAEESGTSDNARQR